MMKHTLHKNVGSLAVVLQSKASRLALTLLMLLGMFASGASAATVYTNSSTNGTWDSNTISIFSSNGAVATPWSSANGANSEALWTNNFSNAISGTVTVNNLYLLFTNTATNYLGTLGSSTITFAGANEQINFGAAANDILNIYASLIVTNTLSLNGGQTGVLNLYGSNNFTNGTIAEAGSVAFGMLNVYGTNYGGSYNLLGTKGQTIQSGGLITNASAMTNAGNFTIANGGAMQVTNFVFSAGSATLTVNDTNQFSGSPVLNVTNLTLTNSVGGNSLTVNSSFSGITGSAISAVNFAVASGGAVNFNNASTNATNNTFGSSTVTLNGGSFNYSANSSSNSVASVIINAGANLGGNFTTTTNASSTGTNILNLTVTQSNAYSTLFASLANITSNNSLLVNLNTNNLTFINGILPWFSFSNSNHAYFGAVTNAGVGTNWLVNAAQTGWSGSGATTNMNAVVSAQSTMASNSTLNSLAIFLNAGVGTNTLFLGGFTLTLYSGGLAMGGNPNNFITNGTITTSTNYTTLFVHPGVNTNEFIGASIIDPTSSNALSLVKAETGGLTLSGSNTYSGSTVIEAGALYLNGTLGSNASYSGSIVDNGFLNIGSSSNQTLAGSISGSGSLTQSGTGTTTLSVSNSYSGATTVSAGALVLGNANALGSGTITTVSGGMLSLNGNNVTLGTLGAGNAAGTINDNSVGSGTSTLTLTNLGNAVATLFTDGTGGQKLAVNITKSSSANNYLNNTNNTFSGGLTLSSTNGALYSLSTAALASAGTAGNVLNSIFGTGTVTIGTNATDKAAFQFQNGQSGTILNNVVFNAAAGGNRNSPANITFVNTAATQTNNITFAGTVTANLAPISIESDAFSTSSNTTVNFNGQLTGTNGLTLWGYQSVQLVTVNVNNTNAGATGTNTLGGPINLAQGPNILNLYSGGLGTGTITISAGTFNLLSTNFTLSNTVVNNSSVNANSAANQTISGNMSGSGSLSQIGAGTTILSGSNSFSGPTTVTSGALSYATANALSQTSSITVTGGTLFFTNSGITNTLTNSTTVTINGGTLSVGSGSTLIAANLTNAITVGSTGSQNSFFTNAGMLSLSNTNTIGGSSATATNKFDTTGTLTANRINLSGSGINVMNLLGGSTSTVTTLNIGTGSASSTVSVASNAIMTNTSLVVGFTGGQTNTLTVATGGKVVATGTTYVGQALSSSTNTLTNSGLITGTTLGLGAQSGSNNLNLVQQGAGTMSWTSVNVGGGNGAQTNSVSTIDVFGGLFTNSGSTTIGGASAGSNFGGNNLNTFQMDGGVAQLAAVTMGSSVSTNGYGGTNQIVLNGGTLAAQSFAIGTSSVANGTTNLITFNGGTLQAASGASTNFLSNGIANVTINSGGGTIDNSTNNTIGAAIGGVGALTKTGAGTLTLSGSNGYQGGTLVSAGKVLVGNSSALGTGVLTDNATVDLNSNALTVGGLAGSGVVTNTATGITNTLTLNTAGSSTFTGSITNGGTGGIALTMSGTGTQTLSGNNSYTGPTAINGGTLKINGTNTTSTVSVNSGGTLGGSGSAGAVTVASGGTLSPGNSPGNLTVTSSIWNNGASYNWQVYDAAGVAGTGYDTLTITGALDLTGLTASGFNINLWTLSSPSATNGLAINFNQLASTNWTLATYGSLTGTFNTNLFVINTGATNGTAGFANAFSGTFGITTNANSLLLTYTTGSTPIWSGTSGNLSTIGITNDSTLIFTGAGGNVTNNAQVASLTGINYSNSASSYTFSGNDITNGGGGIVNNSSASQTVALNLTLGTNQTFNAASGNLTVSGAITNAGNTLTIAGANSTALGGIISGSGGLTKTGSGTTTISAADTFTGTTAITGGKLVIASGGSLASTNINVGANSNNQGVLDVSAVAPFTVATNQTLSGYGSVVGDVTVNGNLNPGLPSAMTFSNNLTLNSTAKTTIDVAGLGGAGATNGFTQINILGNYQAGGLLSIQISGGLVYNDNTQQGLFQVFNYLSNSLSGNYTNVAVSGDYTGTLLYYSVNQTWQAWNLASTDPLASNNYVGLNMNTGLLTVIPEPNDLVVFGGILSAAVLFYRRRKAHKEKGI